MSDVEVDHEETDGQRVAVTFVSLSDSPEIEVIDPIERHRYTLVARGPVSPRTVEGEDFRVPVDSAVTVSTEGFRLPSVETIYVRDADGEMLREIEHVATAEFPEGVYEIEVCAPIKLYLRVESPLTVESDLESTRLSFGGETDVLVGARSHHEQPAATVTTTDDPQDMMAAVSTFGSALKTTSPERSFPTLRGHPPTVELGDQLDVPDGLEPPADDLRIELPPTHRAVYLASSLGYYLGAPVVPGPEPRLVADSGFSYRLDAADGLAAGIDRLLKRTFFLDCLTRTEGLYPVDLHERQAVDLDLDFAALYEQPLAERVEAYLDVPFPEIEPHLPTWGRAAHVAPAPGSVELLPYLVYDLALVRSESPETVSAAGLQAASLDDYLRTPSRPDGGVLRSSAAEETDGPYVQVEGVENALEQVWVGDGMPVNASKAIREGFEHRFERDPAAGSIEITVVCNDAEMAEERTEVDDVYGSREDLPFEVQIERDLAVDELRQTLAAGTDFLHYIGHIDADGFECADGRLDAETMDVIDVDTFLLNACSSYEQGRRLVEGGAIGGIVTLSDVINSGAVRIGRTVARLLNQGFPLQTALDIARDESVMGGLYVVVGDGGSSVVQPRSAPVVCMLYCQDDSFKLEYQTYSTRRWGLGAMVFPYISKNKMHYLVSGDTPEFKLTTDEIRDFFNLDNLTIKMNGQLRWSDDVSIDRF